MWAAAGGAITNDRTTHELLPALLSVNPGVGLPANSAHWGYMELPQAQAEQRKITTSPTVNA